MKIKIFLLLIISIYIKPNTTLAQMWQQKVDYNISVTLDDKNKTLMGKETIIYINNSPDTLYYLYFHLWANAYKNKQTPYAKEIIKYGNTNMFFAKEKDLGYIDNLDFKINNQQIVTTSNPKTPDIIKLIYPEGIAPNSSVEISTPFLVKLPFSISRSGYDKNGFFSIAQWYPKPAVYDKNGWHPMSYQDQGEFYSEFGDYNITITLPRKYAVAATGTLQNDIEKEWLSQREKISLAIYENNIKPDSIRRIPYPDSSLTKSLNYIAKNVHDFAWFCSKSLLNISQNDTLQNGEVVKVSAFCQSPTFLLNTLLWTSQSLKFFSENIGAYPYADITMVEMTSSMKNAGGMEYPMIGTFSPNDLETTEIEIAHEVGHNWWYGILANNERDEPFWDESINSYYEIEYTKKYFLGDYSDKLEKKNNIFNKLFNTDFLPNEKIRRSSIAYQQRLNQQQSLMTKANDYSYSNYYTDLYAKGPLSIDYLAQYIGKDKFDAAIKDFYKKFAFHHFDNKTIQTHFESFTNMDLSWFFEKYLYKIKPDNIGIQSIKSLGENNYKITLKNPNKIPVRIAATDDEETMKWFNNGDFITDTISAQVADITKFELDIPWLTQDNYKLDNTIKTKGIKKIDPLQIRFIGAADDPSKRQLYLAPMLGGNAYDKFMLGMAIYNRFLPAKHFEYLLVPMYAFGSKQFNWHANLDYYFTPNHPLVRQVKTGISSRSFSIAEQPSIEKMYKLEEHIDIKLSKNKNTFWSQNIALRNVTIWQKYAYRGIFDADENHYNVTELKHQSNMNHPVFPVSTKSILQINKRIGRILCEANLGMKYRKLDGFLRFRAFGAGILYANNNLRFAYNKQYTLSVQSENGETDLLYDHNYFGRFEQSGIWSQQVSNALGGFRTYTPKLQSYQNGQSANWVMTFNAVADFPIKYVPIKFFAGVGFYNDKLLKFTKPNDILGELGVVIAIMDDVLQINIPLLYSKPFKTDFNSNQFKFWQKISFSINFEKLNLHSQIREDLLSYF